MFDRFWKQKKEILVSSRNRTSAYHKGLFCLKTYRIAQYFKTLVSLEPNHRNFLRTWKLLFWVEVYTHFRMPFCLDCGGAVGKIFGEATGFRVVQGVWNIPREERDPGALPQKIFYKFSLIKHVYKLYLGMILNIGLWRYIAIFNMQILY